MYHIETESGTKLYTYQVWKLDECRIPTLIFEGATRAFSAKEVKRIKARQYETMGSLVKVRLAR